jgi:uncharacterized protein YegJ (DUF2314 family)
MRLAAASSLCLLLGLTGCGHFGLFRHAKAQDATDETIIVNADDSEMNGAIQTAQWSLDTFVSAIQKPHKSSKIFMLKKQFYADDGAPAHMWVSNVTYEAETREFRGMVANDVPNVHSVRYGDKVNVLPNEVTDWLIVEDDQLQGGFTLRVAYKRGTPAVKKEMQQETGLSDAQLAAPF